MFERYTIERRLRGSDRQQLLKGARRPKLRLGCMSLQ
jgi:hypothetical protein